MNVATLEQSEVSVKLPGETLFQIEGNLREPLNLGPGITIDVESIDDNENPEKQKKLQTVVRATNAGYLVRPQANSFAIISNSKRYIPALNDYVIGQVINRYTEYYTVDIAGSSLAILDAMAFGDEFTKKTKPYLNRGDLVYARIASVFLNQDCEIECFDANSGKMSSFGPIPDGLLVDNLQLGLTRLLFHKQVPAIDALGKKFGFELCIGVNGRVVVNAEDVNQSLIVRNVLLRCYGLSEEEQTKLVNNVLKNLES